MNEGLIVVLCFCGWKYYIEKYEKNQNPLEIYTKKISFLSEGQSIATDSNHFAAKREMAIRKARQDISPLCVATLVYVATNYITSTVPIWSLVIWAIVMSILGRYMLTNAIKRYACEDFVKHFSKENKNSFN